MGVILLTLTDPNIPADVAAGLVDAMIQELSDVPYPNIVIVRDDYHNNEDVGDTDQIYQWIADAGYNVTIINEPKKGITPDMVAGADLIWLSNPGWPTDDGNTLDTLSDAVNNGVDVVLQGDDMTFTHAGGSGTDTLNHLTGATHISNGTSTDGVYTDNNRGANLDVTLVTTGGDGELDEMDGVTFQYGNDIDHSKIGANENIDIYAWAQLSGSDGSGSVFPVVWVNNLGR